jgi:hypothetical protein
MRSVIHFSGFTGDNDTIIVKELAIIDPDLDCSQTWILKPPFPITNLCKATRFNNINLSEYVIGLNWTEGEVDYQDIKNILTIYTQRSTSLYTYGVRRQQFLQDILQKSVINLEDLNCPKYNHLAFPSRTCAHPLHQFANFRCALKEASCYGSFLKYHDLSLYVLQEDRTIYKPTPISDTDSVSDVE